MSRERAIRVLEKNLSRVGDFIIKKSIEELKNQGHILNVDIPGYEETAEQSFEFRINTDSDPIALEIWANDYMLEMDTGQAPGNVSWSPSDMISFGRAIYPGLNDNAVLARLSGLLTLQQKEGVPTRAAFNFTKNGRRTNWIQFAIIEKEDELEDLAELFQVVDAAASTLVELSSR